MKNSFLFTMAVFTSLLSFSSNFKDLPGFIQNKGQIVDKKGQLHPEVQFKLEQNGVNAYFKTDGIMYHFYRSEDKPRAEYTKADMDNLAKGDLKAIGKKVYFFRLDLDLLNANTQAVSTCANVQEQVYNYYLGHCPKGITGVKGFEEITYKDVYPGIDIKYYFKDSKLKYEFIVHPGGDIHHIQFAYKGAKSTTLEDNRLKVESDYTTIIEEKPYTYYEETGSEIKSSFNVKNEVVSFNMNAYDHSKTIVIDPTITWASYYSNLYSSDFHANSAFDSNGNIFTAFATYGNTWPTINAGSGQYYDAALAGSTDLVIARINANYTKQWATYYGGSNAEYLCGTGGDYGKTLGVDAANNVYVGGYTSGSTDFPTQSSVVGGAFYQDNTKVYGGDTPFLLKFDGNGVRQWATMFQHEQANTSSAGIELNGICVSGSKIYFTGQTYKFNNNDMPLRTLAGAYNNTVFVGDQDPFIGRFNSNCILEWSTYFNGGSTVQKAYKQGVDLNVDPLGNLLYVGQVSGASPTSGYLLNPGGGAYYSGTFAGSYDVQIAKFNTSMVPVWSTYYGSSDLDRVSEVSSDASGNILIACRTIGGTGMPTANPGGAFCYTTKQTPGTWSSPGSSDGGIMKFTPAGALYWATYVGGTNNDWANINGISSDNAGNVYVIGYTNTTNFPVQNLAGSYYQGTSGGSMDIVAMKFTSAGGLTWSTYYGGSGSDACYGVKIMPSTVSNGCGYKQFNCFGTGSPSLPTFNPGSGAFYETAVTPTTTTNSNAVLLIEELSGAGNSVASTGITTASTTICSGSTATLTVSGGSLGSGAAWQWYSTSCGVGSVGTGTTITVSPAVATTYYVRAEGTCNTTACSSLTINMNAPSSAATSITTSTTSVCSGGSATLTVNGGSLGTAATWNWYTGSCGGTLVGTGNSITVSPASTTTYYLRAEGACGNTGCVSTVITINSVSTDPSSISASSSTVCSGATTTLTVNGGSLGTAAGWQWFSGSCTGTPEGSGPSITVNPTSATTYYVKAVGSCNTTLCSSITVNVNAASVAPASANPSSATICSGSSSTLTVSGGSLGTGGTWQWYANGCGTSAVASGTSIVVSPALTTAYFVRAEDLCGNSLCAQVTVSVTPTPSATWTSPGTVCTGSGTLNLSALVTGNTGGTWSGTGVTGTTFDPSALVGQTIAVTYSVVNGSCAAYSTQSITVAGSVSAAWTSPGSLCASNGTVNLSTYLTGSTGGSWTGTGVTGTIFDPSALSGAISITYSIGSGTCSDVQTYTINITPAATANWTSPGTLCTSSGTVNLNTYLSGTSGGTWTGTGVSGNVFDPTGLSGQTILIGYQVGTAPCVASQSHSIQVVNVADASFTLPSTLCENSQALNLNTTVTGNAGGTFTGIGVTANTFDPTGHAGQTIVITYSVGVSPCGATQSKTVTISAAPAMPVVAVSNTVICSGQTATVTANGSGGSAVYTVYSSPGATGAIGSTPIALSPGVTTVYYLQAIANGCSNIGGDVSFTVNVNPLPNVDAGANQSACLGSSVVLTATGGGSYVWDSGATTNSIVVTPTVNTTYTVTVTNSNLCVAQDVVTVTILTAGTVQANNDNGTVQSGQSIAVNVASNDTGDPASVVIVSGPSHGSAVLGANGLITYTPANDYEGTDTVRYRICDVNCSMICKDAKLIITVTKEIVISVPGGFSPNGDGHNDAFVIKGLEYYPDNELVIFNRWGDEVFKAAPYKNDWDGQSLGKGLTLYGTQLVEGTYFYILTLDKDTKPMKGYVELKRK